MSVIVRYLHVNKRGFTVQIDGQVYKLDAGQAELTLPDQAAVDALLAMHPGAFEVAAPEPPRAPARPKNGA
jgi:hypothetical protein